MRYNYKIMKETSKILKSATITNNVANGATSFILLIEHNLEHCEVEYIVTIQSNKSTENIKFCFEEYAEAYQEFIKLIRTAIIS